MTGTIRVFVNASPVELPQGADVRSAIRTFDPALERQVSTGAAYVTDGRGIEISSDAALSSGAILRVVVSARRSGNVDADA